MRKIAEQWFYEDNLWPLYTELSYLSKYEFDELDRGAIEAGLKNVDETTDKWFDYDLCGEIKIKTEVTREPGESIYTMRVYSFGDIDREVDFLLYMCQSWKITK